MNEPADIAIIGAGAWGTALAVLYANAGRRTALVTRDDARAALLASTRQNPRLAGITLPDNLIITSTPPRATISLLCPPFRHLRPTLSRLPPGTGAIVLCCKGADPGTGWLGPEIAARMLPDRPLALLTGPNFAHEIAANQPAAAVLAMADPTQRRPLLETLAQPRFRLYGSGDLLGAALGGAAKNVIAIAAGTVIGAGLGENARAALITRGIAEIGRLAQALGGTTETIAGLAGLGDLILTATGSASRNFRAGLALGKGQPIDETQGVIEGLTTAPALLQRAQTCNCDLPLTAAVANLLAGRLTLPETMDQLLRRHLRDEA